MTTRVTVTILVEEETTQNRSFEFAEEFEDADAFEELTRRIEAIDTLQIQIPGSLIVARRLA